MAKYRTGRINEEMKKEISAIIMNGLKDPRITAMITITDVEVTSDL
jgi:ribosome-binding factor A